MEYELGKKLDEIYIKLHNIEQFLYKAFIEEDQEENNNAQTKKSR